MGMTSRQRGNPTATWFTRSISHVNTTYAQLQAHSFYTLGVVACHTPTTSKQHAHQMLVATGNNYTSGRRVFYRLMVPERNLNKILSRASRSAMACQ